MALEDEGNVSADYLFTENELKSKKSTGRLSKGAVEKEIKDEEEDEDEEDEDASQSIPTTANKSVEPNDSANMSSNLEVEKSEKSLDVASSVDDVKNEKQNMISNEEPISSEKKPKTHSNDTDVKGTNSPVKTEDVSTDSPALPPPSSSSLADVNTKEEDEQNDADESAVASTQEDQSALGSSNEVKQEDPAAAAVTPAAAAVTPAAPAADDNKEEDRKEKKEGDEGQNPVCDLLPPTPTSVPCVAPLTLDDTINMDTSTAQQSEENESLIVHVDDTQNDLDADLLASQTNGLKSKQAAKEKAIGKTEGKKSDVGSSPPKTGSETGGGGSAGVGGVSCNKGNPDDVKKTEKKADEKKDEKKDGKLKSCPSDSKLKIDKNLKDDNQNTGNLWISGLSSNIKAADLKELFSKYGKVVVVKVVTNARTPGAQCRVFLTMSSSEEASKCIQHLNQTELHGKKMSVERAKSNLAPQTVKEDETKLGEKKTVVKKNAAGQNSWNLWISGLSSETRAADLKALFSKYGKVVDAKVVTNVRSPGARCYGFLTMFSSEEASKCIQRLNQIELHGNMISVERAKNDPGLQSTKKIETKPGEKETEKPEVKEEKKEGTKKDEKDKKPIGRMLQKQGFSDTFLKMIFDAISSNNGSNKSCVVVMGKGKGAPVIGVKRGGKEGGITDNKSKMAAGKEKLSTTPKAKSKENPTATEGSKDKNKESKKDVLSLDRIKAERDERLRQSQKREVDREREIQRDIQRKQKVEDMRLQKIRRRLRMEREKLESEKLERERIKLEREYLEHERIRTEQRREEIIQMEKEKLEREKLERQKIKIEREYLEHERRRTEQRRAEIIRFEAQQRRALKRPYERSNVQHEEGFGSEPKRPVISTSSSNRFEHGFTSESRFEAQQRRALKRPYDRSNVQHEGFGSEPKRPAISTSSSNRFEHGFTNESRFDEFEPRDYERRVEHYERRDTRSIDNIAATRFEERKDRDLARRDIGAVREIRDRDDRHPDERSHSNDRFDRFEAQQRRALKRPYERSNVQHEEGFGSEPKRPVISTSSSNRFEHGFTSESRFEAQQRRALKRPYDRSNVQHEGFGSEPKRPAISTSSSNRFEHGFTNESRFDEFEPRDYERRVERYERRDTRSIDNIAATRFEERKDRDLARRDIGAVREIRDRDDRHPDERSHSNDRFDRREAGPSRDRSSDRNHETNRRELGPDRGRDSERRNLSAHDRLGRVRNSPNKDM